MRLVDMHQLRPSTLLLRLSISSHNSLLVLMPLLAKHTNHQQLLLLMATQLPLQLHRQLMEEGLTVPQLHRLLSLLIFVPNNLTPVLDKPLSQLPLRHAERRVHHLTLSLPHRQRERMEGGMMRPVLVPLVGHQLR